ncbi:MAG: hypothetical protein ABI227_09240 [Rhodanobacter sp.]
MKVWELRNGLVNETATLVYANEDEMRSGMFDAQGAALTWTHRPTLEVFAEPRRKKPKPRADISTLRPGALVLNGKAFAALGDFLSRFGQLLALDCDGATEYFYNVTTLIDCIDPEHSVKRASGSIAREAFVEQALPREPAVFKDPLTAKTRIYVNDAARSILLPLIDKAALTGAEFVVPGTP